MGENNFDGFWTFDIGTTTNQAITKGYEFSHVRPERIFSFCWYPATLPPRSFVFSGDLVTLKSHSILRHSLNTGEMQWELDLDEENDDDCSDYFVF
mmetsp:Transcript_26070/g.39938  ORF Transcript_26070/g.39938 Transcript_26070/m.39938 type:complete len:96 (+) Transcript_26070:1010-1297(+)